MVLAESTRLLRQDSGAVSRVRISGNIIEGTYREGGRFRANTPTDQGCFGSGTTFQGRRDLVREQRWELHQKLAHEPCAAITSCLVVVLHDPDNARSAQPTISRFTRNFGRWANRKLTCRN